MNRRALLRLALGAPVVAVTSCLFAGPAAFAQERASRAAGNAAAAPARKPGAASVIMLDPGHGGRDPGAIGARGTQEKDITLDIAKEVARQMERTKGVKVRLTRDSDVFLSLKERVELARAAKADLFISIHADSAPNAKARGLSAYTLSEEASDSFAAAIAQQENLAGALGVDMSHLDKAVQAFLVDLAADHTRRASYQAKAAIVQGAGRDLTLLDNPKRSANFAVLKAPDVPSILIETGFLSNREDERQLRDPAFRRRVAGVLSRELNTLMRTPPFV